MSERQTEQLDRDVYRDKLNWSTVAVAAVLAGLQLYEGLGPAWQGETPAAPSLFVAGVIALGIGIYVTNFWRPVLYLLGAIVGLYVLVVWLLGGMTVEPTSVATAVAAVLLAVLCLVNVYREQVAYLSDQ